MPKKELVTVLGAGNMGTSIAQIIALNGYKVNLWNHSGDLEPLNQIKAKKENINYLPGIKLSKNINPEPDMRRAVFDADVVFFAVPSGFIKLIARAAAPHISRRAICVDTSKGMEIKSLCLITDILKKCLPKNKIASISGPAIAAQMVRGKFTAMNVASKNASAIGVIKKILENKNLKLFSTNDMAGVEAAGSFKNVYAIGIGIGDGLKMPTNTKAVLLAAALNEIGLLVKKMGGRAETVYGLAGLGDLLGTGLAESSRNRRLGEAMARGLNLKKAAAKVGQVVEGVPAARALNSLSKKYKLKTPFADMIYKIIFGSASPKTAMENFLQNLR